MAKSNAIIKLAENMDETHLEYGWIGAIAGTFERLANVSKEYSKFNIPDITSKNSAGLNSPIKHMTHIYKDGEQQQDVLLFEGIDMTTVYPNYQRYIYNNIYGQRTGSYYIKFIHTAQRGFLSIAKDTLVELIPCYIDSLKENGTYDDYLNKTARKDPLLLNRIIFVLFLTYYHLHLTMYYKPEGWSAYLNLESGKTLIHATTRYFTSCGINIIKVLGILQGGSFKKSKYDNIPYVGEQIKEIKQPKPLYRRYFQTGISYINTFPFFRKYATYDSSIKINSTCLDDFDVLTPSPTGETICGDENKYGLSKGKSFPSFMTDILEHDIICELFTDIFNYLASGLLNALQQMSVITDMYNLTNTNSFLEQANDAIATGMIEGKGIKPGIITGLVSNYVYLNIINKDKVSEIALAQFSTSNNPMDITLYYSLLSKKEYKRQMINIMISYIKNICDNSNTNIDKQKLAGYVNFLKENQFVTGYVSKKCPHLISGGSRARDRTRARMRVLLDRIERYLLRGGEKVRNRRKRV